MNICEETPKLKQNSRSRLKKEVGSSFLLYPNPATNQLNFDYLVEDEDEIEFMLYDVLGKLQFKSQLIAGEKHQIKLTKMDKGVYFYRMNDINKVLKSGKLIIE